MSLRPTPPPADLVASDAARALARPDAAERVADAVLATIRASNKNGEAA